MSARGAGAIAALCAALAACAAAPTGTDARAAEDGGPAPGDARADAAAERDDARSAADDDARADEDATGGDASADRADAGLAPDDAGAAPDDAGPAPADLDRDGLDDADEARWAAEYLPALAVAPDDRCPLQAVVYRLRPHPQRADRLHLLVVNLFERDCGAGGHVGDDEVFGVTIDPARRGPAGILAIRAIAHQATACEEVSECGPCAGLAACTPLDRGGQPYPAVFFSSGKHGAYASEATCDRSCFFTNFCTAPAASATPTLTNVGEPDAPLVRDLTAAGVITAAAGWTAQELFGFDPWSTNEFGGAGVVGDDLVDDAFLTPACPP